MGRLFKNSWALFLGYGILIIAHGLQGNLLGVRAVIENFNIIATGALMSGYFIGYFIGANAVPNLVGKVGHIRVFAAFASMASLSILLHAVIVDPYVWIFGRFLTGFSIIGIFIVSFAKTKFIENKAFARNLLICIGLMVISAQTMAYILIPSSPFIYLGWGSILMFLVSLWGYRKLS